MLVVVDVFEAGGGDGDAVVEGAGLSMIVVVCCGGCGGGGGGASVALWIVIGMILAAI